MAIEIQKHGTVRVKAEVRMDSVESVFIDGIYTVAISDETAKIGFFQDFPAGGEPAIRKARVLLTMSKTTFAELSEALATINGEVDDDLKTDDAVD